jgi:hypothetical protein
VTTAKIVDANVTDAKLADAKLSLASGGTVSGNVTFNTGTICMRGTLPSTYTVGVWAGSGVAQADSTVRLMANASTNNTYIDFGYAPSTITRGRIIVQGSNQQMQLTATGGVQIASAASCTSTLAVTGAVTCSSTLSATTGTFSGVVSRNQHHCVAYISAGPVALAASTSLVLLPLNATLSVRGTNPFNAATSRFVAPDAGMYMISVHWLLYLTTATLNTQIRKNGTLEVYCLGGQLTHVTYLTTSDYVEIYVRHADSASQNIDVTYTNTCVTCTLL